MNDKEILYNKSRHITYLLETLCDTEIDKEYYESVLNKVDSDLDYANTWLEHILANNW